MKYLLLIMTWKTADMDRNEGLSYLDQNKFGGCNAEELTRMHL